MIRYTDQIAGIRPEQLAGFFEGWPDRPTPDTHLKILAASNDVVLAIDDQSGAVVGFITAISDGVLSAYIPLLEVLPDHRGQGIGHELLRRMLLRLDDLYMIDLICDARLQHFYQSVGMEPATGMMRRNYERQSGRHLGDAATGGT
ncbi:MAG: GNAT family N-acetyltransferase [Planctomycetota bacterium]|jgi:ribosomal protein S18 acetylase RimI-like enzyme